MNKIHIIRTGVLGVNTIIVALADKKVFIVDPAASSLSKDQYIITDYLKTHKLECIGIVLTHSHFDHIMGIKEIKEAFPKCSIAIHENEYEELISPPGKMNRRVISFFGLPTIYLEELSKQADTNIALKDQDSLEVLLTSNKDFKEIEGEKNQPLKEALSSWKVIHTPGHTRGSICLYNQLEKILLSGDTIFNYGGYGRTDMYGGNEGKILKSIQMLESLIPEGTMVYPGHDSYFTFRKS